MNEQDAAPLSLSDHLNDDVQEALWRLSASGPPAAETLVRSEDDGDFWDMDLGYTDCYDCGFSADELTIGIEDGQYSWHLHVGCYTTVDFKTWDKDEFVQYLHTEIPYFERAFPANLAELRQVIDEVGAR